MRRKLCNSHSWASATCAPSSAANEAGSKVWGAGKRGEGLDYPWALESAQILPDTPRLDDSEWESAPGPHGGAQDRTACAEGKARPEDGQ